MIDGNDLTPELADQFNAPVIEEFRANRGEVGGDFAGLPILLLHHVGARSGADRITPVIYLTGEDRYLVFASKGGADTNPAWYHNLKANPDTVVEVGAETLRVRAEEVTGTERDVSYAEATTLFPGFADYQRRTDRDIPVLALVPTRS